MILVQPKKRTEAYVLPVSFLSRLPRATNLSSASCVVSVYSGADPAASEVVSNVTTSGTDALVTLPINKGVPGVIYQLRVKGVASSQSWDIDVLLAVLA